MEKPRHRLAVGREAGLDGVREAKQPRGGLVVRLASCHLTQEQQPELRLNSTDGGKSLDHGSASQLDAGEI
ncbi:MAG: hypothetical protein HYZ53_01560 [Planctomycetes bacterium]|nr:hypothetical protein [Planctomycetota bacterium]